MGKWLENWMRNGSEERDERTGKSEDVEARPADADCGIADRVLGDRNSYLLAIDNPALTARRRAG
jgi:hypothetical protein